MADNIELYDYFNTRTMKHLQDKATGDDKARDAKAVDALLRLSGHSSGGKSTSGDKLTDLMMEGIKDGR